MPNGKVNRIFSIISISIFILVIAMPLIFINKDPNKISIVENKKLATFPKLYSVDGNLNTSFISEFENYISENIGFKQEAVVADIALEYKLFNKIKVPNYIMGKDENLFYTSGGAGIDTYQGKNLLSEDRLYKLGQAYSNMQSYFESTGSVFYMMTIPDKEAIYPEYFPDEIKRFSSKTRIDLLVDYMKANTNVNVFNVKQALYDNKSKDMLYYKNYDCTHWNMNGAFVGYTEIMKQVKQSFPDINFFIKDDFDISTKETKGAMGRLRTFKSINDAMSLEDTIYNYYLKDGYHAKLISDVPECITVEANDNFFHYVNKDNSSMPKIFIIGDSYLYSFLLPILAESFSELYFTNFTTPQEIMDLQNYINADVVLYEFVERVFNTNIDDFTDFRSNTVINNFDYKELPCIDNDPVLFIDDPINSNNIIKIDSNQKNIAFSGWAIDVRVQTVTGAIYLKIGDDYYIPEIIKRKDLIKLNPEYVMAGFKFKVPLKDLVKTEHIEFIIISDDKTYQYKPVKFSIQVN